MPHSLPLWITLLLRRIRRWTAVEGRRDLGEFG